MKRRPSGSLLISIALHVVLGIGLLWVLSIPYPFHNWLSQLVPEEKPVEHVSYVALPGSSAAPRDRKSVV